ncbi:hypothetical protein HELRODRAFT_166112 [Helobdella robusta]|uniref:Uncharacterized protein n=1 Tax=Helobdella robusta TaxID=6412 RepID=T1EXS4_HELRO|nr:hypothetical protein HELRODRAFT_166112 [Helobdella robusta]ESN90446.1 hypothetical protein HELRODRAFT_166112 [Helobdella robusta]
MQLKYFYFLQDANVANFTKDIMASSAVTEASRKIAPFRFVKESNKNKNFNKNINNWLVKDTRTDKNDNNCNKINFNDGPPKKKVFIETSELKTAAPSHSSNDNSDKKFVDSCKFSFGEQSKNNYKNISTSQKLEKSEDVEKNEERKFKIVRRVSEEELADGRSVFQSLNVQSGNIDEPSGMMETQSLIFSNTSRQKNNQLPVLNSNQMSPKIINKTNALSVENIKTFQFKFGKNKTINDKQLMNGFKSIAVTKMNNKISTNRNIDNPQASCPRPVSVHGQILNENNLENESNSLQFMYFAGNKLTNFSHHFLNNNKNNSDVQIENNLEIKTSDTEMKVIEKDEEHENLQTCVIGVQDSAKKKISIRKQKYPFIEKLFEHNRQRNRQNLNLSNSKNSKPKFLVVKPSRRDHKKADLNRENFTNNAYPGGDVDDCGDSKCIISNQKHKPVSKNKINHQLDYKNKIRDKTSGWSLQAGSTDAVVAVKPMNVKSSTCTLSNGDNPSMQKNCFNEGNFENNAKNFTTIQSKLTKSKSLKMNSNEDFEMINKNTNLEHKLKRADMKRMNKFISSQKNNETISMGDRHIEEVKYEPKYCAISSLCEPVPNFNSVGTITKISPETLFVKKLTAKPIVFEKCTFNHYDAAVNRQIVICAAVFTDYGKNLLLKNISNLSLISDFMHRVKSATTRRYACTSLNLPLSPKLVMFPKLPKKLPKPEIYLMNNLNKLSDENYCQHHFEVVQTLGKESNVSLKALKHNDSQLLDEADEQVCKMFDLKSDRESTVSSEFVIEVNNLDDSISCRENKQQFSMEEMEILNNFLKEIALKSPSILAAKEASNIFAYAKEELRKLEKKFENKLKPSVTPLKNEKNKFSLETIDESKFATSKETTGSKINHEDKQSNPRSLQGRSSKKSIKRAAKSPTYHDNLTYISDRLKKLKLLKNKNKHKERSIHDVNIEDGEETELNIDGNDKKIQAKESKTANIRSKSTNSKRNISNDMKSMKKSFDLIKETKNVTHDSETDDDAGNENSNHQYNSNNDGCDKTGSSRYSDHKMNKNRNALTRSISHQNSQALLKINKISAIDKLIEKCLRKENSDDNEEVLVNNHSVNSTQAQMKSDVLEPVKLYSKLSTEQQLKTRDYGAKEIKPFIFNPIKTQTKNQRSTILDSQNYGSSLNASAQNAKERDLSKTVMQMMQTAPDDQAAQIYNLHQRRKCYVKNETSSVQTVANSTTFNEVNQTRADVNQSNLNNLDGKRFSRNVDLSDLLSSGLNDDNYKTYIQNKNEYNTNIYKNTKSNIFYFDDNENANEKTEMDSNNYNNSAIETGDESDYDLGNFYYTKEEKKLINYIMNSDHVEDEDNGIVYGLKNFKIINQNKNKSFDHLQPKNVFDQKTEPTNFKYVMCLTPPLNHGDFICNFQDNLPNMTNNNTYSDKTNNTFLGLHLEGCNNFDIHKKNFVDDGNPWKEYMELLKIIQCKEVKKKHFEGVMDIIKKAKCMEVIEKLDSELNKQSLDQMLKRSHEFQYYQPYGFQELNQQHHRHQKSKSNFQQQLFKIQDHQCKSHHETTEHKKNLDEILLKQFQVHSTRNKSLQTFFDCQNNCLEPLFEQFEPKFVWENTSTNMFDLQKLHQQNNIKQVENIKNDLHHQQKLYKFEQFKQPPNCHNSFETSLLSTATTKRTTTYMTTSSSENHNEESHSVFEIKPNSFRLKNIIARMFTN